MTPIFSIRPNRMIFIATLSLLLAGGRLFAQPSFAVHKEGKGRPMIFIPGLECSGEVWKDAVKHFSNRYTCYTLTLPGFAGQPPISSDSILQTIVQQLAVWIRQEKIEKPVIVGHSLGGWLALSFAVQYPELAGDLIIVSSAPFLPALSMGAGVTADSTAKIGLIIKNAMKGLTPIQVKQSQHAMLAGMMRDSARIVEASEMAVLSDQPTQGEVMYELFSQDLRPVMGHVRSRILALADWSSYKAYGATREGVQASLQEQYKKAGHVTIAMNDESKHFIMFDEPEWFYGQADQFLR